MGYARLLAILLALVALGCSPRATAQPGEPDTAAIEAKLELHAAEVQKLREEVHQFRRDRIADQADTEAQRQRILQLEAILGSAIYERAQVEPAYAPPPTAQPERVAASVIPPSRARPEPAAPAVIGGPKAPVRDEVCVGCNHDPRGQAQRGDSRVYLNEAAKTYHYAGCYYIGPQSKLGGSPALAKGHGYTACSECTPQLRRISGYDQQ